MCDTASVKMNRRRLLVATVLSAGTVQAQAGKSAEIESVRSATRSYYSIWSADDERLYCTLVTDDYVVVEHDARVRPEDDAKAGRRSAPTPSIFSRHPSSGIWRTPTGISTRRSSMRTEPATADGWKSACSGALAATAGRDLAFDPHRQGVAYWPAHTCRRFSLQTDAGPALPPVASYLRKSAAGRDRARRNMRHGSRTLPPAPRPPTACGQSFFGRFCLPCMRVARPEHVRLRCTLPFIYAVCDGEERT
jgi:hypothetical protein